jgi:hypothetical protein
MKLVSNFQKKIIFKLNLIDTILVNQVKEFELPNMTAEYIELSDWSEYDVYNKKQ